MEPAGAVRAAADSGGGVSTATPVTVLCGFLGAGKTTTLKHMVTNETRRGRRIAAIANDVAALNIDGSLIAHACMEAAGDGEGDADKTAVKVLTLEGGSVCSSLQDDLAAQLGELVASDTSYDHIFVECSGVTHPAAISSMFLDNPQLAGVRLHATVTVVDCFNLRRVLLTPGGASTTVEDAWRSIRAEWDDSITNLYIEQIECASVLILNKADIVTPTEYESCRAVIEAFNQRTQPIRSEYGAVDVSSLIDAPQAGAGSLPNPHEVLSSRRWLQNLTSAGAVEATPEATFSTFVYERRRPFHPLKLRWFVMHKYHTLQILRSKGFCWMATRNDFQGEWSGAGAALTVDSMCRWYSSLSEQEWVRAGLSASARTACEAKCLGDHGDRRQELVFIGMDALDEAAIVKELDACLVDEDQMDGGAERWASFDDPWSDWSITTVESKMESSTRDAVAEREKFKVSLWMEREQHQAGQTVSADAPTEIRKAFEEFRQIGETQAEAGELEKALVAWDEALLIKGLNDAVPVSSIAAVNEYEAQLLMEMGDYYGAIHTCDRALEVCPAYLAALHTKGRAQLEMGELSMARDTFLGVKEAAAAAGADGDAALQVDDEGLAEDIARAEVLMAEAAKLEAETGGQVLRGELVLPGAKWNKSCYGSRLAAATPGEVNCDTRNRLYLNLLMSKALDVGAAAKPEDYVSDQTTAVYGLLPVRVGCPVSQPLVRQLQCCLSLEPLNKLLGADQEALGAGRSESLRVPTSVCRDGEAPRDAAARAYEAYYGSNLGTLTDLWQPDFVPPIVHYHQLPTGDTQVQTYFVVVCPPEVTGANTQESSVLVAEFGQQLVEDPQLALARLREVTALLLARNRWTPEQIAFSILIQVAEALVKTELKPAADGWYDPTTIVTTAEQMFARQSVQQLVSGLLQCPEAPDVEAWSIALLGAVELLCVRWNIKSSLVPMVQSLLQHCGATVGAQESGLITPLAALRWYARDPRAIVIAFGDASSEQARMEMLVGIHGVRTSSETAEWVKLLRQQQPDAAAAHDASHKDVSSSERCIWSRADRGLVGAAGQIALKAQGLLQEAAAAGLMNQASPDWDRLVSSPAPAGKRSASEASTEPGAKRKRVVHNVTTDVDLIIIGAGASGVGCGVMAKKFGIEPSRTLIIERGSAVGSTFDQWPAEMRFITPSFNQQAFGFMDLNSVAFDTSPAQLLHEQHPTGPQYAEYLREVSRIHALPVACETDVTAVTPIGAHGHAHGHGHGHGAEECEHTVGGGFEVSVTQSPNATHKLPAKIRTKFVIWAAGEFQYPRKEGFPGASEHCLHNSRVGSWNELSSSPMAGQPQEDVQAKERIVIGGYESGMDAAVHLANAGVKVTVMASTPFWSMRTLDPSTELAPFTAGRLQAAQAGANPPTLMSHCRVVGVEKEEEAAGGEGPSGYVVVAERTAPTDADEMAMDEDQPTAIVPQSTKDKKTKKETDKNAATTITAIAPAPEIVRVRTSTKPILATGFHSGVAKTVNHLFEWTEESLCATDSGSTDASGGEDEKRKLQETASASEAHGHGHGHGHGQPAAAAADAGPQEHSCDGGDDCSHGHGHSKPAPLPLPLPGSVMPTGDAKLTKCDESTIYPGLFLSGPQVRQDDQIFCFVYKYRQRFAVVMNEIATRMGLQTEKVVVECRKQHMFLDDPSCCKATCGSGSC